MAQRQRRQHGSFNHVAGELFTFHSSEAERVSPHKQNCSPAPAPERFGLRSLFPGSGAARLSVMCSGERGSEPKQGFLLLLLAQLRNYD